MRSIAFFRSTSGQIQVVENRSILIQGMVLCDDHNHPGLDGIEYGSDTGRLPDGLKPFPPNPNSHPLAVM